VTVEGTADGSDVLVGKSLTFTGVPNVGRSVGMAIRDRKGRINKKALRDMYQPF
jgi:hypothetical protein